MAAEERDMNRDPITDEPGSHPVGTGIGAVGGAVAGATIGVVGGPIGMAVGGVVGALVGGFAGKAAGEAVNPTAEEAHWRDNYDKESYYEAGRSYDDYAPAYQLGMNGRTRYQEDWDAAEPKLASEWESSRGGSSLSWPQAQQASQAAWNRVDSQRIGSSGDTSTMGTSTNSSLSATGGSLSSSSGSTMGTSGMRSNIGSGMGGSSGSMGSNGGMTGGAAGAVGSMQSASIDEGGGREDALDVLEDLAECSKDGEYGFRACAEQAERQDLKTMFMQRADECRKAAQELNQKISTLGGTTEEGGSATGAIHRGWVSVKTALSTRDDKAVLEECERGEDVALARYRKAMKQNLPADVKQLVEKQMQGVQKNHDQIKMLRDQFRAAS